MSASIHTYKYFSASFSEREYFCIIAFFISASPYPKSLIVSTVPSIFPSILPSIVPSILPSLFFSEQQLWLHNLHQCLSHTIVSHQFFNHIFIRSNAYLQNRIRKFFIRFPGSSSDSFQQPDHALLFHLL